MSSPAGISENVLSKMDDLDRLAIENLREYLRIPSVHPNINYGDCVEFVKKQARSLGLPVRVYQYFPNKPIVIVSWIGKEPNLPSILLNGHMDVVPVFEDQWTYPPFGAEMDENGNIYARGAQDTKSTSIHYLEAIRRLKKDNITLKRTIHVSFVPDEEIGGAEGMEAFVKSKEFKALSIGFALDEGIPGVREGFFVFYGDKSRWSMRIHCPGEPGHGSRLLDNTAGEKAKTILDKVYALRQEEKQKIDDDPSITLGEVTSLNLTIIEGGVQSNVVPPEFILTIDCRLAPTVDLEEFENTLNEWCEEAGDGVWIEYELKEPHYPMTKLDESNPYWIAFKKAVNDMNLQIRPNILVATTDMRFVRTLGIPALGFQAINHTRILAHSDDEYVNKDKFLRGIDIYYNILTEIGNVDEIHM